MDQTQQWTQWLTAIPIDQQQALHDLLKQKFSSNGHHLSTTSETGDEKNHVEVTRIPTRDLYVTDPPPYVDILKLHEVYNRISYEMNVIIKGAKGIAKSLSVVTYAAITQTPIIIQECSEDVKSYHLMGSQSLLGTKTIYTLGSLPLAIDVANEVGRCILLFEEINGLTPQVQKQLNALTDFRRMVSMPHIGKSYKLKEESKLWVVATMNSSVYGGTYDLNEDLKSRFEEIEVTYPEVGQEKNIVKKVCGDIIEDSVLDLVLRFARETRQQATGYALSTRDVVRLTQSISKLGLQVALQFVLCKFEGDDREVVMRRMQSVFGQTGVKKYWSP